MTAETPVLITDTKIHIFTSGKPDCGAFPGTYMSSHHDADGNICEGAVSAQPGSDFKEKFIHIFESGLMFCPYCMRDRCEQCWENTRKRYGIEVNNDDS